MDASTKQRPRIIVLVLMTLMVLLVSVSSFFDLVIMNDWVDLSEVIAFGLPAILFIALIYVLVKYGYMKHLPKYKNRSALILTLVSVVLLSLPIAYIVGTKIFRGKVLEGNYSSFVLYSDYSDNSVYPGVSALHIGCFLGSLLIFGCVAASIFVLRKKISYKTINACAISSSLLLFGFSTYTGFNVKVDTDWYYGSEKALAYNTDECYKNAIEAYELCCKYNDKISEQYSADLNGLLKGFEHFSDAELEAMSLKEKSSTLENWKDLLTYNAHITPNGYSHNLNNSESAEFFKRFWETFKLVHNRNSKIVNLSKLQSLRDNYTEYSSNLKKMNCSKMNNSQNLQAKNEEFLTLIEKIDKFVGSFMTYSKFPVETKHQLVTWEGQERRQEIDALLNSYKKHNPNQL